MAGGGGNGDAGGSPAAEAQRDRIGAAVGSDGGADRAGSRGRQGIGIAIGQRSRAIRRGDRDVDGTCGMCRRGGADRGVIVDGKRTGCRAAEADGRGAGQVGAGQGDRGAACGTAGGRGDLGQGRRGAAVDHYGVGCQTGTTIVFHYRHQECVGAGSGRCAAEHTCKFIYAQTRTSGEVGGVAIVVRIIHVALPVFVRCGAARWRQRN